jgi:hypothetical protein
VYHPDVSKNHVIEQGSCAEVLPAAAPHYAADANHAQLFPKVSSLLFPAHLLVSPAT